MFLGMRTTQELVNTSENLCEKKLVSPSKNWCLVFEIFFLKVAFCPDRPKKNFPPKMWRPSWDSFFGQIISSFSFADAHKQHGRTNTRWRPAAMPCWNFTLKLAFECWAVTEWSLSGQQSCHVGFASSHLSTEVKHPLARTALGW